jgi:hypothetical protein
MEDLFTIRLVKEKIKQAGCTYDGAIFFDFEKDGKIPTPQFRVRLWDRGYKSDTMRAYTAQGVDDVVSAYVKAFNERKAERRAQKEQE